MYFAVFGRLSPSFAYIWWPEVVGLVVDCVNKNKNKMKKQLLITLSSTVCVCGGPTVLSGPNANPKPSLIPNPLPASAGC